MRLAGEGVTSQIETFETAAWSSRSRLFRFLSGSTDIDTPAMRSALLQSILDRRFAIVGSSIATCGLALTALLLMGSGWAVAWLAADLLLLASRWRISALPAEAALPDKERAIDWLMLLGMIWALLLGFGVYGSYLSGHVVLMLSATAVAAGAAGVVSARNAGTPRQGRILIACICVPAAAGALQSSVPGGWAVAGFVLVWIFLLFSILQQNYEIMVRLIVAELGTRTAARTDALTGLSNRFCFNERLDSLKSVREGDPEFFVLYLDLDGFKAVNDRFGHAAGDELLRSVSQIIRESIRGDDAVYRLGGDEFAVILMQANMRECEGVSRRLISAITKDYCLSSDEHASVGVSIGSASSRRSPGAPERVLRSADAALYRAKAAGKGIHVHAA